MRQIISLLQPTGITPRQQIFAGCCPSLLRDDPSRRYSTSLSLDDWICIAVVRWLPLSVPSPTTSAFPMTSGRVGIHIPPLSDFRVGCYFATVIIPSFSPPDLLATQFAPTAWKFPRAAVAFTSKQIMLFACIGYTNRLFRTIDGTETFTPLD